MVEFVWWIKKSLIKYRITSLIKCVPLLVIIWKGQPNCTTINSYENLTITSTVFVHKALVSPFGCIIGGN